MLNKSLDTGERDLYKTRILARAAHDKRMQQFIACLTQARNQLALRRPVGNISDFDHRRFRCLYSIQLLYILRKFVEMKCIYVRSTVSESDVLDESQKREIHKYTPKFGI